MRYILRGAYLRVARNSGSVFLAVRISGADVYNIRHEGGESVMEIRQPDQAAFDQKMFEKELHSLRKVSERGARNPPQDLSYTIFVLLLLWLIVGAPFLTGALLALSLGR
jgi:hypothetical protein